jgi:replicative superfamily II helicase
MKGHPISSVRFVAVSATIPNIQDLARWLAVPPSGVKFFGEWSVRQSISWVAWSICQPLLPAATRCWH